MLRNPFNQVNHLGHFNQLNGLTNPNYDECIVDSAQQMLQLRSIEVYLSAQVLVLSMILGMDKQLRALRSSGSHDSFLSV